MSNWGYDDNDNAQAGNNLDGPKALREAYDKLKQQNDDLNTKLTSFLEDQQKQQLGRVFNALGVPAAQQHYKGDADPQAIEAWVNDMKATFGGSSAAPASEPVTSQPTMNPAEQHQYNMMVQAGQNEAPLGNFEAAQTGLSAATDVNSLIAAMAKLNGGA